MANSGSPEPLRVGTAGFHPEVPASPSKTIARVKTKITHVAEPSPAQATREARMAVTATTARGRSLEDQRVELLQELDAQNEVIAQLHNAPEPQARERLRRKQTHTRLAAVDERRRPSAAYSDACAHYVEATRRLREATAAEREDALAQTRFWREQVDAHGQRLAEEQVEHDLQSFDLDVYHRGLERQYAKLAENEAEYEDDAPELLEMAFLKQKMQAFAGRMENPKLQQRLHVERERTVLARRTKRTQQQITRLETHRRTLNWLNPFQWGKIRDTNEQLARLRHELEDIRVRSTVLAINPPKAEMSGPLWPKNNVQPGEHPLHDVDTLAAK